MDSSCVVGQKIPDLGGGASLQQVVRGLCVYMLCLFQHMGAPKSGWVTADHMAEIMAQTTLTKVERSIYLIRKFNISFSAMPH